MLSHDVDVVAEIELTTVSGFLVVQIMHMWCRGTILGFGRPDASTKYEVVGAGHEVRRASRHGDAAFNIAPSSEY